MGNREPSRSGVELDLLARLLEASPRFWQCPDLPGLGALILHLLEGQVPLGWAGLWMNGVVPQEGWAVELPEQAAPSPSLLPGEHAQWLAGSPEQGWSSRDLQESAAPRPGLAWFSERGFQSCLLLPFTSPQGPFGGIALASRVPGAFDFFHDPLRSHLARFLSQTGERLLRALGPEPRTEDLARDRDRQRLIIEINNQLAHHLEPRNLFKAIAEHLQAHFHYEAITLALTNEQTGQVEIRFVNFPSSRGFILENVAIHRNSPIVRTVKERRPVVSGVSEIASISPEVSDLLLVGEGLRSFCSVPLLSRDRAIGALNFGSRNADNFPPTEVELLCAIGNQVAIALDNAFAYEKIQQFSERLYEEKLYLEGEVLEEFAFGEIVGHSLALQSVLRQVQTVAPCDATVLLLGETGTGKELVARALHNLSLRKDHTFVKMNCAAIPLGLVESELFGHEKGAFTGAITQRTGRLELAHQGSLFLDEVGELSLDVQPKLLRAIQEREFERLGGTRTQHANIRLIAATNRDLAKMVQDGSFRSDLYFRLKVFPIHLPPLRERKEDIPLLVNYFARKYGKRMNHPIETIPAKGMEALMAWPWPGNIRELENFIERSVILSRGPELHIPASELIDPDWPTPIERHVPSPFQVPLLSIHEAERAHILRALDETGGKIGGPDGAAAKLGLKRTTLQGRMRKLGIGS